MFLADSLVSLVHSSPRLSSYKDAMENWVSCLSLNKHYYKIGSFKFVFRDVFMFCIYINGVLFTLSALHILQGRLVWSC